VSCSHKKQSDFCTERVPGVRIWTSVLSLIRARNEAAKRRGPSVVAKEPSDGR
jgi:hypothetical protein